MKKYLILVLIVLIVGTLVIGVQAAGGKWVDAQRVPLYPVPTGNSWYVDTTLPSQGEVVFVDPMGNVTFIIQGNVEDLLPNHCYTIWVRDLDPGYTGTFIAHAPSLGYYKLDTFTTNDEGRGKFHLNICAEDLSIGEYDIQLAINDGELGYEFTVLATELWVTVSIKS
ncbi:MAG TPA: hypothetical protein HA348_07400 [Thermoplasmata archaeon]|nr:hypothetical protein [Thermoplasmata archaeon]